MAEKPAIRSNDSWTNVTNGTQVAAQVQADNPGVITIGIGAGASTAGQVLVLHDMLHVTRGKLPRFVRNFMTGNASPLEALQAYVHAIKDRSYPAPEHCFS